MALPSLVEYLAAIERPGGGRICSFGSGAVFTPYFPAATTLAYSITPAEGIYAQIFYKIIIQALPDAFQGWFLQGGIMPFTGTIPQKVIDDGIDMLAFVSAREPSSASITNVSGLAQSWRHSTMYLEITNEESMRLVNETIREYGGAEAKGLLQQIKERLGASFVAGRRLR